MPRAHFYDEILALVRNNSGEPLVGMDLSSAGARNNLLSGPLIYWRTPMNRRAGIMFVAGLLALTLWSLTAYSAVDDDDKKANKEAQEAVVKLLDSMNGRKGDVKAQAEAIKKKFMEEVKPVMWVYKSCAKGGLGFGKDGDDIEQTIGKIGNARSKLSPKKVLEMKGELAKAAELSLRRCRNHRSLRQRLQRYQQRQEESGQVEGTHRGNAQGRRRTDRGVQRRQCRQD